MHVYVSEVRGSETYRYARYLSPQMTAVEQNYYIKSYQTQGLQSSSGDKPFKVYMCDDYRGLRIDADGEPLGRPEYQSRQLIMTKRIGEIIHRMIWAHYSTPTQQAEALDMSLKDGWMMHTSKCDDVDAWDRALETHRDIERHRIKDSESSRIRAISNDQ